MAGRKALHQRTDSDTNSAPIPKNLKNTDDASSPHKATTSSKPGLDLNNSKPSAQNDTVRSTGTARSSTIRSTGTVRSIQSLDSLPPVPPLRIHKDRTSIPPHWTAKTIDSGKEVELPHKGNTSSASNPLRSILKKFQEPALPPLTAGDYQNASRSWTRVDAEATSERPALVYTSPTLRLVENEDEGPSRELRQTITPAPHVKALPDTLASSSLPTTSSHELNQSQAAGQFPVWARYFYGRNTGKASAITNPGFHGEKPTTSDLSNSETSSRPWTGDVIQSHHVPTRSDHHTSEAWSLPHLDHRPFARVYRLDRQIILFCLGFILPLCWFIAAFLPLPEHLNIAPYQLEDPESAFSAQCITRSARMEFERQYENARWWRRINRTLSILGVLVIMAIVILVLIAVFLK
ncbi:hypothetical protein EDC01DRAFT_502259 [Geopyxis carbonaria]|nr:hypothetical protein EDC01DRAFT_502259 [Geopyxis carbonaria]